MSETTNNFDPRLLLNCVPIDALTHENFRELVSKTRLEKVIAGRKLFQSGDKDNKTIYLLEGSIELRSPEETKLLSAGSPEARHPVSQHQPRQCTATAKSDAVVVRIDSDLLDLLLTWDQSSGVEVEELDGDEDGDWMSRLLQTQSFRLLPPANIQALFMRLEQVPVRAGEKVITQGDDGDYYYMISEGRCQVTRSSPRTQEEIVLAELVPGQAFGEEALISESKRNATITMLTDGTLMRLGKKDFLELMKEPLQQQVSLEQAKSFVTEGGEILDVRLPSEYNNEHLPGSRNIPLFFLRKEVEKLDPGKHYILVCDTGRRSSAAAFILSEQGFEASVLSGGMVKLDRAAA
jgi:CRP-like cAMP-binding protein